MRGCGTAPVIPSDRSESRDLHLGVLTESTAFPLTHESQDSCCALREKSQCFSQRAQRAQRTTQRSFRRTIKILGLWIERNGALARATRPRRPFSVVSALSVRKNGSSSTSLR